MAVDIPHLSGVVPYLAEQAFQRLRESVESLQQGQQKTEQLIAAMPVPLTLDEIQQALGPQGSHTLPTAGLLNTTPPQTSPGEPPAPQNTVPDHSDIVATVSASYPTGPTSTLEEIFRFTQALAWAILGSATDPPGFTCGLLYKPSGENIFTCAGISYSISRVCYPNGQIFKVLADAGVGGANTPQWVDNGTVDPSNYRPATDPASPC